MPSKLPMPAAAFLLTLGLIVGLPTDASAGGASGGKATGSVEMFNPDNGNVTFREVNVQEREGNPAKGFFRSTVTVGPDNFYAGNVTCAVINGGTAVPDMAGIEDKQALFVGTVDESLGHVGPPEYFVGYIEDGGEPTVLVDKLKDMFIEKSEHDDFCAWVVGGGSWPVPGFVGTFLSDNVMKESIGGGNLQVHLD